MKMKKTTLADFGARLFNQPVLMRQEDLENLIYMLTEQAEIGPGSSLDGTSESNSCKPLSIIQGVHHIPVIGALMHRAINIDYDWIDLESYENLRRLFYEGAFNSSVKTRLLELDSGGGEAAGCFDFANYMLRERGSKKTIAFVNEKAYSACYAIAACCDEIYLTPSAGVGSIGVVQGRLDRTKYNERMGLHLEYFTSGSTKTDGNPNTPLLLGEKRRAQQRVLSLADTFFDVVSQGRNIPKNKIQSLEAACLYGEDAVKFGLADGVMSQDEIGEYLKSIGKEKVSVISIFGQSRTEKDDEINALKAELSKAKDEISSLKAQYESDAKNALRQTMSDYESKQTAFVSEINEMCSIAGAEEHSGMLIEKCSSVSEAKQELSKLLSKGDGPHSYSEEYQQSNRKNFLLDAVQNELKMMESE